jgi:hypothetical protein
MVDQRLIAETKAASFCIIGVKQICVLLTSICIICLSLITFNDGLFHSINTTELKEEPPMILAWTRFFSWNFIDKLRDNDCPFVCRYTDKKR